MRLLEREISGNRTVEQLIVEKVVPGLDCSARGAVSLTAAVERRPRVLPSQRASLPAIVLLWRRDVGLHVPVVEVSAMYPTKLYVNAVHNFR